MSGQVQGSAVIQRVLLALAGALPEASWRGVTGLSVRQGWGGIVSVRVHTSTPSVSQERDLGRPLRAAVRTAMEGGRHDLAVVSDPPPVPTSVLGT